MLPRVQHLTQTEPPTELKLLYKTERSAKSVMFALLAGTPQQ
jgi:hypothetical protein